MALFVWPADEDHKRMAWLWFVCLLVCGFGAWVHPFLGFGLALLLGGYFFWQVELIDVLYPEKMLSDEDRAALSYQHSMSGQGAQLMRTVSQFREQVVRLERRVKELEGEK